MSFAFPLNETQVPLTLHDCTEFVSGYDSSSFGLKLVLFLARDLPYQIRYHLIINAAKHITTNVNSGCRSNVWVLKMLHSTMMT